MVDGMVSWPKTQPMVDGMVFWPKAEDDLLRECMRRHGTKWSTFAPLFPDRSISAIRNRWQRMKSADRQTMHPPNYCKQCGLKKRGHSCPYVVRSTASSKDTTPATDAATDEAANAATDAATDAVQGGEPCKVRLGRDAEDYQALFALGFGHIFDDMVT